MTEAGSEPREFALRSGHLIVPSAQVVAADDRTGASEALTPAEASLFLHCFGRPMAEALFVLGSIDDLGDEAAVADDARMGDEAAADAGEDLRDTAGQEDGSHAEPNVVVVRLGLMTQEAVANYLPDVAEKLTKPKTFFVGGEQDPMVTAIGWIAPQREDLLGGGESGEVGPDGAELVFGSGRQFLRVRIDDDAPSIDEQVLSVTGSADPAALKGLRLFHSFEMVHKSHVEAWVNSGCALIMAAEPEDVFTERPLETWRTIMKRRPFPENLFATWTDEPEWN